MPASQNVDMAKGKNASAAITKKRFVKIDATDTTGDTVKQCDTAGEKAYGVALFSVSATEITKGKGCSVLTDGRAIVEQGVAGLTVGTLVTTDTSGRAIVAATGNWIMGVIDEMTTAGVGNECSVDMTKSGGKV